MKLILRLLTATASLALWNCAPPVIPMRSSLNDMLSFNIKSNSTAKAAYLFDSKVTDGLFKLYGQDKKPPESSVEYNVSEATTFRKMCGDYMSNKFSQLTPDGEPHVTVQLNDFWMELYTNESGASVSATVLGGGSVNYTAGATVKLAVIFEKGGQQSTKIISASSEEPFIAVYKPIGSTSSDANQAGMTAENAFGKVINDANNKAISFINKYLEEQSL